MSDTSTNDAPNDAATNTEVDVQPEGAGPPPDDADQLRVELERWKTQARRNEERAKANVAAVKELEKLKQSSMTDLDRAVAQARSEGETEAMARYGQRLVDAEVRAACAGRKVDVAALLGGLDRSRFIGDDGEPDSKAIATWVDRLTPKPTGGDIGQGRRVTEQPQDMNALIRAGLRRH